MVLATLLFAAMGVCVKLASAQVSTAEVVFFRGLVGVLFIGALAWGRGLPLRTRVPAMHFWRGFAGVVALSLWFYAIAKLPLGTAVTFNYTSSVWMAVFFVLQTAWLRWRGQSPTPVPRPLLLAIAIGFMGVALVLRPTLAADQWLEGLMGLASGMLAAWAYLQVMQLGRAGEPEYRVVFYFSVFGTVAGLLISLVMSQSGLHAWRLPQGLTWVWLIGLGVFATLAQLLMTRAYARGEALAMASLQYLGIAHAFVLGVLLFDDPVDALAVVGTGLIVAAGVTATRLRSGRARA
ncbi:DMT family transporter [Aquabacterium sp. A3]|uniref:DMT family transporter n=1 Tax=Aquabacterium sp. A3 TaxID=3132829 RepID=UPI003119BCD3